jgi:pimeloyl-ACP methyl ester carboxylesterase
MTSSTWFLVRRWKTLWWALLAVLGLAVAGWVAAGQVRERDFDLRPCADGREVRGECGRLTVFENRPSGRGRQIDIHFQVFRAERPGARQALFLFTGGPGQGSTIMAAAAHGWARSVRATQDIVLVDQRGTGRSHPLDCGFEPAKNPAAAFGHVFDPAAVSRCRTALERHADLTQYTTELAIEDVEDIRARLGYDQVSLYGGSYGTRMAQSYLRRYPGRVRAVVLDGVVPFDNAVPVTYARSAQQALDRVFAACAATPACRAAHPNPAADLAAILRRLEAGPARATITRRTGPPVTVQVSAGDFTYAVRGMLYDARAALRLPDLLGRAVATGRLDEFAQRYFDREAGFVGRLEHGVHFTVLCAEDVPFPTEREIEEATSGTFIGRYLFDEYRNACARWPRAQIGPDARTPVSARVPTLLISGWFDPSTPPEFAERVARSLPESRLLVARSSSHVSVWGCAGPAAAYVLAHGSFTGIPQVCGEPAAQDGDVE